MKRCKQIIIRLFAGILSCCLAFSVPAVAAADEGSSPAADSPQQEDMQSADTADSAAETASVLSEDSLTVTETEDAEDAEDAENSEDAENTITISTVQELLDFADSCRSDSWSVDKTVVLQNDISLKDTDFSPIPSFGGTFQGQGYTISGLSIRDSFAPAGFFAELQSTATVRDLNITGTVTPSGSGSNIGGIAGRNAGSIINCSFSGTVEGETCTGGLVGINLETGIVSLSHMDGSVTGMSMTGGIAGSSSGTILGCESFAQVNNVSVDPEISIDDMNLSLDISDLTGGVDSKTINVPTDSGGIAGFSDGNIIACVSSGVIGYQHVGYNVGGIAGRSSGYMMSNRSESTVYGRKDVGGIVGQCEPYISQYVSDSSLTELQDEVTDMVGTLSQLQTDTAGAEDELTEQIAGLSDSLTTISSELQNINTSVSISVPDISSVLGDYTGSSVISSDSISDTISSAVSGGMDAVQDSIAGSVESAITDGVGNLAEDVQNAADNAVNAGADAVGDAIASGVESAVSSIDMDAVSSAVSSFASGVGANATTDLSGVRAALTTMSGEIAMMNTAFSGQSDVLDADMAALAGQATDMTGTVNDLIDEENAGSVLVDTSSENPEASTYGKIFSCENSGTVEADLNVGGIAGIVAIEYASDPEDDLDFKLDDAVTTEYDVTSVIYKSSNTGKITGKRDCVGGIAGKTELGIILSCESYGPVESTSGDYVGGIVGQNGAAIRKSYAKLILAGGSYVGGITGMSEGDSLTGNGSEVDSCISMISISRGDEYTGAISGSEDGTFSQNYFVSDTLFGLNRVSRTDIAEQVDYDTLISDFDVPENFRSISVTFVAQDTLVDSLTKNYGDALLSSEFPEIPAVDGKYGTWDRDGIDRLTMDTVIQADYAPYITAIRSEAEREDGRPVFYAEGNFSDTAVLEAEKREQTVRSSELPMTFRTRLAEYGREVLEQWTLQIPDDGADTHTIRCRTVDGSTEHISIWLKTGSGWVKQDTETQGSYLCFTVKGDSCEITLVSSKAMMWIWILIGGAALLCILVIILLVHLHRRRKRSKEKRQTRKANKHEGAGNGASDPGARKAAAIAYVTRQAEAQKQKKEAEYRELLALAGDNEIYRVLLQRNQESDLALIDRDLQLSIARINRGELLPEEEAALQEDFLTGAATVSGDSLAGILPEDFLTGAASAGVVDNDPLQSAEEETSVHGAQHAEAHNSRYSQEETGPQEEANGRHLGKKKKREKGSGRKRFFRILRIVILFPVILIAIAAAALLLHPQWGTSAYSYFLLRNLTETRPLQMTLTVSAQAGDSTLDFDADIDCVQESGKDITCITTDGINLYYYDGAVYLENGSAYKISGICPDYSALVQDTKTIFSVAEISGKRDGGYTVLTMQSEGGEAEEILSLLAPEVSDLIESADGLEVSAYVLSNQIKDITFSGQAELNDGRQLVVDAELTVSAKSKKTAAVPEAVLTAMEDENSQAVIELDENNLKLLSAWGSFSAEDPAAANITLRADCSVLSVNTDISWYRRYVSGTAISCVTVNGSDFYTDGHSICTANGTSITADQADTIAAADLIDLALQLCQSCSPEQSGDSGDTYTLQLTGEKLRSLADTLLPQLGDLSPALTSGTLSVVVADDNISDINLSISGNVNAAIVEVPITITAQAHMEHNADPDTCNIPSNVSAALVG